MISLAAAFLRRDWLMDVHSKVSLLFELLNVALTLGSWFFLSRLMPDAAASAGDYLSFALVGLAANDAMFAGLLGVSRSFQVQQPSGVLKVLLASEFPLPRLLLFSSLYPILRGAYVTLLYVLVGVIFGAFPGGVSGLPAALLVLAVALVAFAAMGILAAAFSVLFKLGNAMLLAVGSASWLLSGVVYPVSILPEPLRWAAQALPLTHALAGLRAALQGGPAGDLLLPLAGLLLSSVLFWILGLAFFRAGLRRARVTGTLGE